MFAFLHGEIALISVAYLSGSCKLLPCLLETAPQHHLPGPVSHSLTFFLALKPEAGAQKVCKKCSLLMSASQKNEIQKSVRSPNLV